MYVGFDLSLLNLQAFLDEIELIAQGLIAIRHTDLGHIGLADVVAFWTLLQVVRTQEVGFLLEHRNEPPACVSASINHPHMHPLQSKSSLCKVRIFSYLLKLPSYLIR